MSGKPNIPKFPGMERFRGEQHHSSQHPGPDAYKGKQGRRHRLQQFGPRHLRGAVGGRGRRHHGAALDHPYRALRPADGARPRRALFRTGAGQRHHHPQGGHDLRLAALPDPARVPDPDLRQDPRGRRRLLRGAGEGRLPARLGRGRFRPVHEVSAARLRLLHRRRRLAADHRRQDQAEGRAGGGDHRDRREARRTAPSCRPTSSSMPPATAR